MSINDLDLDSVDSSVIDEDTYKIIVQTEAWYLAQKDKLSQFKAYLDGADVVQINDTEITDKHDIKMMKIGVIIALEQLEDFPLTISDPDEDDADD